MKVNCLLSGLVGAVLTILFFLTFFVWLKPFNYVPNLVVNPNSNYTDSLTCLHLSALNDLENKGVLLTAQEYTSNIADYYNTLIAVLVALFVLFTIGTLFGFRFASQKEVEDIQESIKKRLVDELKDSKAFYGNIINDILGKIEDDVLNKEDKNAINKNLEELENRLRETESRIESLLEKRASKSDLY